MNITKRNAIRKVIVRSSEKHSYAQEHSIKEVEDMFEEYPDIVNLKDLKAMLHIGRTLAYRLLNSGAIESRKIGREFRIAKQAVIDYLSKKED